VDFELPDMKSREEAKLVDDGDVFDEEADDLLLDSRAVERNLHKVSVFSNIRIRMFYLYFKKVI